MDVGKMASARCVVLTVVLEHLVTLLPSPLVVGIMVLNHPFQVGDAPVQSADGASAFLGKLLGVGELDRGAVRLGLHVVGAVVPLVCDGGEPVALLGEGLVGAEEVADAVLEGAGLDLEVLVVDAELAVGGAELVSRLLRRLALPPLPPELPVGARVRVFARFVERPPERVHVANQGRVLVLEVVNHALQPSGFLLSTLELLDRRAQYLDLALERFVGRPQVVQLLQGEAPFLARYVRVPLMVMVVMRVATAIDELLRTGRRSLNIILRRHKTNCRAWFESADFVTRFGGLCYARMECRKLLPCCQVERRSKLVVI